MTNFSTIAYGASVLFHVGLLAGLAVCASSETEVQIHLEQGGGAVVQGSFFTADRFETTRFELQLPSPFESETREIAPTIPEPTAIQVRRANVPIEMLLTRDDLPAPPLADEAIDQVATEQSLQAPKRPTGDEPQPSPQSEPPAQALPRSYHVANLSVATDVVLPSGGGAGGGDVDEMPRRLGTNRSPPYPPDAFQRGQQGRVVLEVHVNAQGAVDSLRIVESSGVESLDNSALETVTDWRFEPARQGGRAVATVVNMPIRFAIRS